MDHQHSKVENVHMPVTTEAYLLCLQRLLLVNTQWYFEHHFFNCSVTVKNQFMMYIMAVMV